MNPILDAAGIDTADLLDVDGPVTVMRRDSCHVCDARNGNGRKLQRCAGCNIALYCSKECQKGAWRTHRFVCRQTDSTKAIHQALEEETRRRQEGVQGPPTFAPDASEVPLVGLQGFNLFMSIHAWSLKTMCHAAVHLTAGGRGAEAFRRDPMVMHFEAHRSKNPRAKPWNAWVLGRWRLQSLEECLKNNASFARKWHSGVKASMAEREAKHRAEFGSRFIGELLVLFAVENTHSLITAEQPILQLSEPEDLQDPTTRGAVEDLLNMCLGYTNKGVPLGQAPGRPQLAFPGRSIMLKPNEGASTKKVWGWTSEGTRDSPWDSDLYLEIFRRVGRKTDLPPMDLILLFYNLTAEVACRSITIGQYGNRPIAWDRRFLPLEQPVRRITG
ncbi:hypothetical protein OH76DRAFT_1407236 [Lentinus brumalis]|uniref:MYND-type domain-containing protein n=1 Tax=Lentinus brumalis TaxID=2498619 RepID=A0A371D0Q0_9APHY|nr:hypothetical protein OH76DRAFT_1407236 [Polyporus brumalis]